MLEKMDGVVLAVQDAAAAAKTFEALFDAKVADTAKSDALGAEIIALGCGEDLIRLAQPTGPGPIQDHVAKWGEGIVGTVFAAQDRDAVIARIRDKGVDVQVDDAVALIDPAATFGLLTMLVSSVQRERVGVISFLYEVTHLVHDWKSVSDFWTDIFGLDGAKFSPIESDTYGYKGMLTLLDPPAKLDRIEVVYPHDTEKAMGKFFVKRGEGPYMFFAECDDFPALRARLDAAGARVAPPKEPEQPNSLFIHPSSTHGVLIGVSPKNLAWVWSGRPELARAKS